MQGLDGKVAVIVGAGTIGGATAVRLAAEGCRVVLGDLSLEQATADAEAAATAGVETLAVQYDQADDGSVAALIQAAVERFGRVDFVHANAADLTTARADPDALEIDLATFDRAVSVNMRGFLSCTRHALPHLVRQRGAIVYTSSGAAFIGEPTRVSYAMTKAGVLALMRHVASRWGKEGVRANAIAPGFIQGRRPDQDLPDGFMDMVMAAQRSLRMGEGSDIAAMVALLFSKDGEWINGQTISIDGGSTMR